MAWWERWGRALAVYADRRVLAVFFLGFSSGLPLALTGSTLAVWMTEAGVSLATIGLFALVGIPYTFKFLWAPLIDRLRLPGLTRRFGRRRGWSLFTQAALIAALLALGASDPAVDPGRVAVLALIVAFCSASQDIVIDAYRVELLDVEQYGAGAAAVQFGYRIAMLVSGAGALFLASVVEWFTVYAAMAGLVGVGILTVLLTREPGRPVDSETLGRERRATEAIARRAGGGGAPSRALAWLYGAVVSPFHDMAARHGWMVAAILAFVLLYKLGDAMAGMMANPFYVKMGFSKEEIAGVSKVFGFGATILGTFVGGLLVARMGLLKSLLVCGLLQMLSNLMFAYQATVGHDIPTLIATIGIENLAGGMGSAAFVAYISSLCSIAYTGTQYALLSSLAAFGRTLIASSGGVLVEGLGWVSFFVLSTAAALPGILLLLWLMRKLPLRPETAEARTA